MRIARGVDEARSTVLRRAPLEAAELPSATREVIRRTFGAELGVTEVVDRILHEVREQGDVAVNRYNQEIDGVAADPARSLEVTAREIEAAYERLDAGLVGALREAAERIRRFHKRQLEHSLSDFRKDGVAITSSSTPAVLAGMAIISTVEG